MLQGNTINHTQAGELQQPVSATRVARTLAHPGRRRGPARQLAHILRDVLIRTKSIYLRKIWGVDIHPSCRFSLKTKFDFTNPSGVHIGEGTYIAFGAVILAHDMSRLVHMDTYIGKNCFIGAHSIILPGIRIHDCCIVGAGAVVTKDIPPNSLCAGNPARVVTTGIITRNDGILCDVYDAALAARGNHNGPDR